MKEKFLIFGLVGIAAVLNIFVFADNFDAGSLKAAAIEDEFVAGVIEAKVNKVFEKDLGAVFPMNQEFCYGRNLEILAFGDVMMDRGVRQYMDKFGADYPFEKVAPKIAEIADANTFVFANLEGPVLDRPRVLSGGLFFSFKPDGIDAMKKAGFNIVNLANNHTFNQKVEGFDDTKRILAEKDIAQFGVPIKSREKDVYIEDFGSGTVAFIGYDDIISPIDEEAARDLIAKMSEEHDYVIVSAHWGQEYKDEPNARQQRLGHMFIDAGADAVIGHHPHEVQPMEMYNGKPIFYSLGNFVFDQYFSADTQQGLAVKFEFKRNYFDGDDEIVIEYHPFKLPKSQPYFLEGQDRDMFLQRYGMD